MALVMLPSPSVAQLGTENALQGDTGPLTDSGLTPSPTSPSQRGFPRGEAPTLPRGEGQRTPVCYDSGHRKGRGGSLSGPSMPASLGRGQRSLPGSHVRAAPLPATFPLHVHPGARNSSGSLS